MIIALLRFGTLLLFFLSVVYFMSSGKLRYDFDSLKQKILSSYALSLMNDLPGQSLAPVSISMLQHWEDVSITGI